MRLNLLVLGGGLAAIAALFLTWALRTAQPASPAAPAASVPWMYAAPGEEPITPLPVSLPLDRRKVALGGRLFRDPRLSRDNSVACATCHVLAKGGMDGLRRSVGIAGQRGAMNAPSVFNVAFNFRQFWDGRAATLEEQVDGPVHNALEMASDWPTVIARLKEEPGYREAFAGLYRDGIQPAGIRNAIAEFERSLLTPGARFDRYLQGERDALSLEEIKGYQRFKNYGCVACHQGVNVGGNLYQRLGVMRPYFTGAAARNPANRGRAAVTGRDEDLHVFKVPSLRNVELTAPYFHDGSIATLEQAVSIMGQYQLGVAIPADDVALIVRFLRTLTGTYAGASP